MSGKKKGMRLLFADADLDLVPMIDCVFLILLFFMLCGRISTDQRSEQITVPPTKTANKLDKEQGWEYIVLNVFGTTTDRPGNSAYQEIWVLGQPRWKAGGDNDYSAYVSLRNYLDRVYDSAEKYPDPTLMPDGKTTTGLMLPKVAIELRADADAEFRVVQELQQVLSGTINPATMLPMPGDAKTFKPFVHINFTTRKPGEK